MRHAVLLGLLSATAFAQQPTIASVENAASNVPSGLPNAGIALGSMFVVKGTNLGPTSIATANSFPLQTSLGGVSISINIGGRTLAGIMYYALDRQVAAILPSTAFAGNATLTLTYNGRTSVAFPIVIATSNVAVYTLSSTGTGAGVVALADNTLVTPTNAPNPGDVVVIYANGLGPVTFDETRPAQVGDLLTAPLEVFVGGIAADILYKGRNPCCSSVDQINVRLPLNVSGCVVPIAMRMANLVSNTATIPIALRGRVCNPSTPGLTSDDVTRFLSRPGIALATVAIAKNINTVSTLVPGAPPINTVTRTDLATASFFRFPTTSATAATTMLDVPVPGSCTITSANSSTTNLPTITFSLDAGDTLTLSGLRGEKTLTKAVSGTNIIYQSTLDENGNFLLPSAYSVRGTGGGGVGAFDAQVVTPAAFNWTNQSSINIINRLVGLTITWTGGDPNGLVEISGTSAILSGGSTISGSFTCIARGSFNSFTVPPSILLALPLTGTASGVLQQGDVRVRSLTSAQFQAPNIDIGTITYETRLRQTVVFQ